MRPAVQSSRPAEGLQLLREAKRAHRKLKVSITLALSARGHTTIPQGVLRHIAQVGAAARPVCELPAGLRTTNHARSDGSALSTDYMNPRSASSADG